MLIAALVTTLGALALCQVVRGSTYWDFSEGVYALSARLLLHGGNLYGGIAAAQPPPIFVLGAGLLAIDDSITWLRLGVGVLQAGGALCVAGLTWRLTGSRVAAIVAGPLALLTPWAVHEHGQLTPELVGGPLLFAGAVLATGRRARPVALGLVLALAAFTKVPYLLPAVAVALLAPERARTLRVLAAAYGALLLASLALVGPADLWRNLVVAQFQTGRRPLHQLPGMWAQAGWNLLGLLVPAGIALHLRAQARNQAVLRVTVVLALTLLATAITTVKHGTGLNALVPVEGALVPLALAGAVWAVRSRALEAFALAGLVLVLAQGISVLASSPSGNGLFLRPGSKLAYAMVLDDQGIARERARVRACPPGAAYSGPPYLAFVLRRRMPAGQPDTFITTFARVHRAKLRARQADLPECPLPAVTG